MNTIDRNMLAATVTPVVYNAVQQGMQRARNDVRASAAAVGNQLSASADAIHGNFDNHVATARDHLTQIGHAIDTFV